MADDRPNPHPDRRAPHPEVSPTSQWTQGGSRRPDDTIGGGKAEAHDPMTDDQIRHLEVLAGSAGESFDRAMTRAEADAMIQELERRAGKKA